jgi:hypothetical protein
MNATEVGNKLVELYNKGDFESIYGTLYSPNIVSVEADGMTSEGMEGIQKKNEWWESKTEVHSTSMEGPFPNGDNFGMIINMDCTDKESGHRYQMKEIGWYTVADGKIVKEQFCYTQG